MPFNAEQKQLLKIGYCHSGVPRKEREPFGDWLDEDLGDRELFGEAISGLYTLLAVGAILGIVDTNPQGTREIHLSKTRGKSLNIELGRFTKQLWDIGVEAVEVCDLDTSPFTYSKDGGAIYPGDIKAKKQIFRLFEYMQGKPLRK